MLLRSITLVALIMAAVGFLAGGIWAAVASFALWWLGLALLAAYALLGDEGLSRLIPSPQKADEFFFPV